MITPMFRVIVHFFHQKPRLAFFSCGVGLSIVAGIVTDSVLSRRVAANDARIREMGFPIDVKELNAPAIPDESNPASILLSAANIVDKYTNTNQLASDRNYTVYYPFDKLWIKQALAAEQSLSQAFDMTRQTAQMPPGRPNIKYSTPIINVILQNLSDSKLLASVVCDSAYLNNLQGDPAAALDRLMDLHAIETNTIDDWFLICHLYRLGEWTLLAEASMTIGATLKEQDLPQTREKIRRLIAILLDESSRTRGIQNAFAGERLAIVDTSRFIYRDTLFLKWTSQGDEIFATQYFDFAEQIINSPDWNKLRNGASVKPKPDDPRILSQIMMPSYTNAIERHFQCLAETRAAALALAAHLYRMEHSGAWPSSSADLVPNYLPFVLTDPYYPKPTPFEIKILKNARPDGQDRPMVLFNLAEMDLGPNPSLPVFFWERSTGVQHRDLTLFDRILKPNEQAQIADSQKADEARNKQDPEERPPEVNPDEPQKGPDN